MPERADAKLRYQSCLSLANLNPTAALGVAAEWSKARAARRPNIARRWRWSN